MVTGRTEDRIDRWRDVALHGAGRRRREWAVRRIAFAGGPRAARALGEIAVHCTDDRLRHLALTVIAALTDPPAVDAVCEVAIAFGDERLQAALTEAGHEPSKPERRALWLLLTGRFDRHADLDFDGALLRAAYRDADLGLRRRIAERARAAGRVEWMRVPTIDSRGEQLPRLDEHQWQTSLSVLADTRRYDELWRLLPQAPLRWAARILVELGARDWRPADDTDRAAVDTLLPHARNCRTLPTARSMFDDPVTVDGGPVLAMDPRGDLMVTPLGKFKDEGFAVRRLADGEPLSVVHDDNRAGCGVVLPWVNFSPGGDLLAVNTSGALRVWRTDGTAPPRLLPVPSCCRTADFAVLSTGALVVSQWCYTDQHTTTVQFWDLGERPDRPVRTVDMSFGGYVSRSDRFAVSPGEKLLITTSHGRSSSRSPRYDRSRVAMWRLPSAEPVRVLVEDGPRIQRLTVGVDGRLLLTEGEETRVWHLPSGIPAGAVRRAGFRSTALLPDARVLTSEGQIHWPLDPTRVDGLTPSGSEVGRPSAVSPDGTLLVTGLRSSGVAVWHLPDGTRAGELDGDGVRFAGGSRNPGLLHFTAAGVLVASHSDKIMLWNPRPVLTGAVPASSAASPPDVHALRTSLAGCPPADRAWLDLLEALVMWRHRHDVAIPLTAAPDGPAESDIELRDT